MRVLVAVVTWSLFVSSMANRLENDSLCPELILRKQWGALPPKSKIATTTVGNVIIHHSLGPTCITESTCRSVVRTTQLQHVRSKGWEDIGYNFLVSENGQVFEGRGWGVEAAGAMGLSSRAVHIAIIGTFNHRAPAETALKTVVKLIQCGVDTNRVSADYKISAHRDVEPTACPGQQLYAVIRNWERYVKRP